MLFPVEYLTKKLELFICKYFLILSLETFNQNSMYFVYIEMGNKIIYINLM